MITPEQVIRNRMEEIQPLVEEYRRLRKADEELTKTFGPIKEDSSPSPALARAKKNGSRKTSGTRYSPETKAAAVARYAETGSYHAVAKEFKVATSTLKFWVRRAQEQAVEPVPENPPQDEPQAEQPREVTTDV